MKIKQILRQSRRDFWAIFRCENCGYECEEQGYDDAYFHGHVIPDKMACPQCGKTEREIDPNYRPLTTKYPEGMQV